MYNFSFFFLIFNTFLCFIFLWLSAYFLSFICMVCLSLQAIYMRPRGVIVYQYLRPGCREASFCEPSRSINK